MGESEVIMYNPYQNYPMNYSTQNNAYPTQMNINPMQINPQQSVGNHTMAIATEEEVSAIESGLCSGVHFVLSVHAMSKKDLSSKVGSILKLMLMQRLEILLIV